MTIISICSTHTCSCFSFTIIAPTFLFLLSLSLLLADAYNPVDFFIISCGSSGTSSDGVISWSGDLNSHLLHYDSSSSSSSSSFAAKPLKQSPNVNQVPFTTARLSRSQFTYSFFPVSSGQKFIRLFFYPTSYSGFNRSDSFFSVTSGGFTLLKNFNASLTADANHRSDTVVREYIVNVDLGHSLNLTFTANKNSYAFVNGIQIVSMPTGLYYTKSNDQGFELIGGSGSQFTIGNSSALETQCRLNVRGKTLSVLSDTGMLRSWSDDNSFVTSPSSLDAAIVPVNVTYSSAFPDYIAPSDIYQTARVMGSNGTWNKISNLTWEFVVDSGYTYMVRLHFCEIDPNIKSAGDRAFFIYIANQLAESHADILLWTKWGTPIYRDYAVQIPWNQNQKKSILSLQMRPLPDDQTSYSDPFLNGVEIFKISDPENGNLAGPNPDPLLTTIESGLPQSNLSKGSNSSKAKVIGVVAGVIVSVVLLSTLVVFFVVNDSKSTNMPASSLPTDLCRYFPLSEIKTATNNFDDVSIIGMGGFGNVYKGYIDDGATPVAIKRLKPGSQQGAHEFKTEIEMLSQLRHLHLVSLIGYCNDHNEMILVYHFMARGTLRDHLYGSENPPLTWKKRLQICIGAAKGLHYLHTGATHVIIHRDVKSTNILLDEKWVAKVSDFGLSRIGPTGISKAHVSTVVKGSIGYLDPEYYKRQRLTEKSDVYSFGVVLFEILCARPVLIRTAEKKQVSLADWGRSCYEKGTLAEIVDASLDGKIGSECLKKFGELAVSCVLDDGTQRPSMNDVVWGLEFVLRLQENAQEHVESEGEGSLVEENEESHDENIFSSSDELTID